ncbi:MAG TPA: hypothetical protein VF691_07060, partial [Cytophagaceae bacterium]
FGGKGDFSNPAIDMGNVRRTLEREVQVGMPPLEFAEQAPYSISVERAREILKDMGIADLPQVIYSTEDGRQLLESSSRLTPEQIKEFIRRALGGTNE